MEKDDLKELENLRKSKKKAEKRNDLKEVATLSNYIGKILADYGEYEDAITEHETERSISETLHDVIGEAVACRKIGECYCSMGQYDKAISLQTRHLDLAKSCDDILEEQRAWATIGRTYLCQAEATQSRGPQLEILKKAEDSLLKSLEVCERLKPTTKVESYMEMKERLFLNMGLVYDGRGEVKSSAEYFKRAISIAQKYRLYHDVYRCQNALCNMYQKCGNMSQALRALDDAQKNAVKLKDKHLESDCLLQKAQLQIKIGDYETAKNSLKKAKKLGLPQEQDVQQLYKLYKAATKMEESSQDLETAVDEKCRMKLYETLADCSVDANNYKQALDYYHKMLKCATDLGLADEEMVPIYVSLAQTYCDDKQYTQAITYYKQELTCHTNNLEQTCRTWLNIAEAEEHLNLGYNKISKSYLAAFEAARKTKHRKLQVQVLKSLAEVQKHFKQKEHLIVTEKKLDTFFKKYENELVDLSDEESQPTETLDDDDVIISDLSESEPEEEDTNQETRTRCSRKTNSKAKVNEKGETPLHRACIAGHIKKVKKLIEQGHPVNPRDFCGWIPLHEAANHDFYDIVEYLLNHGAHVNDRGGASCGGVTPLIDASNCGNMEIVELLVNKGANKLAKDDEGQTALDCLNDWYNRCEDTLSGELKKQYVNTVKLLQNTGSTRKTLPNNRNTTVDTFIQSSDDEDLPDLSMSKKAKRLALLKKTPRPLIEVDSEQDRAPDSYEDSEEIYLNPALENIHTNGNATEDYRSAISLVGKSAAHSSQMLVSTQKHLPFESSVEPDALLSENSYVGDDWLIDDTRPIKRKFRDCDGLMSGNSFSRSQKSNVAKRQRITTNPIEDDDLVSNDSNDICDINDNNFNMDNEDIDFCVIEDVISPEAVNRTNNTQKSLSLKRKAKQTRITSFGSSSERMQMSTSSNKVNSRNINNKTLKQSAVSINDLWDTNSNDSVDSSAGINSIINVPSVSQMSTNVMKFKVKIKDKVLLIPVLQSNQDKTISWLSQEVSQRYYSLYGLRPLLTLSTTEGALLSPDDIISMVLVNNDVISGTIDNWDLPPLHQRYKQACKTLNTVTYSNISNILQTSETTGHLVLSNLALRPVQIQPVFRALQGQNNLTILNLQGNRMGDIGVENLSKTFEAMPNLTSLNVACNNITSIGIKHITDGINNTDDTNNTKHLQLLCCLNINGNGLGDNCITSLSCLISSLPSLSSLYISSCQLTTQCFQQHRILLANSLTASNVRLLDVSCNKFGTLGVELLIKCLNSQKITSLNMADTQSGTNSSHLSLHLQHYFTQVGCSLEELNISGCNLSSDDVHSITRLPSSCPRLHKLLISKNIRITNQTIQQLLQTIVENDVSCLEEVTADGCSIKSPLDTGFLDSLSDVLCRSFPLRFLSFTCEGLDKVDCDCIRQVWEEKWKDLSKLVVSGNHIQLSVSEKNS
ncbi:tonsoku-like protein [Patella vulgata]|uniref:tonsoku-like protein n=1 Tax=Patella vulgata TaxID=6465 RepID=UPI0021807A27|nr:tonsoku-like protein [Patella vulgata]